MNVPRMPLPEAQASFREYASDRRVHKAEIGCVCCPDDGCCRCCYKRTTFLGASVGGCACCCLGLILFIVALACNSTGLGIWSLFFHMPAALIVAIVGCFCIGFCRPADDVPRGGESGESGEGGDDGATTRDAEGGGGGEEEGGGEGRARRRIVIV